jgi:hypothetical protein
MIGAVSVDREVHQESAAPRWKSILLSHLRSGATCKDPIASVQRFLIDCAGMRLVVGSRWPFHQRVCEAVAPSSSVAAQRSESA